MSADPVDQEGKIEELLSKFGLDNLSPDDKKIITDLHCQWLKKHDGMRRKDLEDHEKKLRKEYTKQKKQQQAQFKKEMKRMREELHECNKMLLEAECSALAEKNREELFQAKKMQWCTQCSKAACYHCCWNTAYCSTECQHGHWEEHKMVCRREYPEGSSA